MTKTKTKTTTKTKTRKIKKTNTFGEHLQRAIPDTFDIWNIWSYWWGDMTWPKKRQRQIQTMTNNDKDNEKHKYTLRTRAILETYNTTEWPWDCDYETFDQSDEERWPDQNKLAKLRRCVSRVRSVCKSLGRVSFESKYSYLFSRWIGPV